MRRVNVLLAFFTMLALAVPAAAAWVDNTASWTAQGLSGGLLITDTDNNTMYNISGSTIRSYDAGTDTWTTLTSASGGGYTGEWCVGAYAQGKILLKSHNHNYIQIYDIATDSWSNSTLPSTTYSYGHGQGAVYNPADGKFYTFWTSYSPGYEPVGAAYDVATGTWSADTAYANQGPRYLWGRMQSVTVGTTNYFLRDENYFLGDRNSGDGTIRLGSYDLTQGIPTDQSTLNYTILSFDMGGGAELHYNGFTHLGETYYSGGGGWPAAFYDDAGVAFGTQMMAVDGTDIYIVGECFTWWGCTDPPEGSEHLEVVVYHTATGTWENFEDVPWSGNAYRNHTVTVCNGVLYVQDGSEFYAYNLVPEPATVSLLGLGGLGLLIRRRHR